MPTPRAASGARVRGRALTIGGDLTFKLVPRRRLVGLAFGAMHSARRGTGSDVAGSRPYRAGDDVDTIDWGASARLSSARGLDEFVVRERFAEEAPRVVLVCDRRPEMALFPRDLPWLDKAEAMQTALEIVGESTAKARGFIGYVDFAGGEPFWRPPVSHKGYWEIQERHHARPDFDAPQDTLARALELLGGHRRSVPAGSFVFVLSDFLAPPSAELLAQALEQRWDIVPVVIQDPVWEQSFPAVDSLVIPLARADGRLKLVRLRRREAELRRQAHERRLTELVAGFRSLGVEPIVLSQSDPEHVFRTFLSWSDEREFRRGHGW